MMADKRDGAYVATRLLDVEPARVHALKPLEFLERDVRTLVVTGGKVRLKSRG